jgi:methyl-accepting chemotaxis protein
MEIFNVRDRAFLPAVLRGDKKTAQALADGILKEKYNEHRAAIDKLVPAVNSRNAQVEAETARVVLTRRYVLLSLAVAFLLVTGAIGYWLNRSITANLNDTINALSTTAQEMATTAEQHERTAMQQSVAVNETTTTMDELDASFRQMEQLVEMATETANHALQVADDGSRAVRQSLESMSHLKEKVEAIATQILSLSEQTNQIGTITNLVSDLANQTNMLALNAAVEAARAGEHGRGFAVVATEIRKLADESKRSAKRIHALVEDIQKATNATVMVTEEGTKTVEQGIRLARAMDESFNGVANSIQTASESAQQTLLSVKQQVAAVRQVVEAMDMLNAGARETLSGISQTKDGVGNLRETALKLKAMV